jgi:glucose-1-phosphate adenylyltransferase
VASASNRLNDNHRDEGSAVRPGPQRPTGDDLSEHTLAVVMAGGAGKRLGALTRWHAKPALPFAGQYRNIDFPLSNCVNSGIRRIALLTQYKAHSLIQHVHQGWSFLRPELGEFIEVWPAQQRCGESWYEGTADAVHQNIDLIDELAPRYVLVLAGDHVYRMDYHAMLEAHVASGAGITVGCVEVPLAAASDFGVVSVDASGWVARFDEKPVLPAPLRGDPAAAMASMGIYVFDRALLLDCLRVDAANPGSGHDFGRDVLPWAVEHLAVAAYAFHDPSTGRRAYWRDVGTLDSYWQANMELLAEQPELDLYDEQWPLWTHPPQLPPPRFVGDGAALRSIVSAGCSVGGRVEESLLSVSCRVGAGTKLKACVVLPDVEIGRNCRIRRAIVDSGASIPDGFVIGEDPLRDAALFEMSPGGVAVVTAEMLERARAGLERRESRVA